MLGVDDDRRAVDQGQAAALGVEGGSGGRVQDQNADVRRHRCAQRNRPRTHRDRPGAEDIAEAAAMPKFDDHLGVAADACVNA